MGFNFEGYDATVDHLLSCGIREQLLLDPVPALRCLGGPALLEYVSKETALPLNNAPKLFD